MTAPLVYLVTDRRALAPGRALTDVVAAALRAVPRARPFRDAVAVQLREKDLDGRALLALAHDLRAVTRAAGVRLFVNDRVDVALAAGADGVHLGGGSLAVADVRAVAPSLAIAVSAHAPAEIAAAAATGEVAFAVFGPIFDTPAKRRYGPPLGLPALAAAAAAAPGLPVLAIGGVHVDLAKSCIKHGAGGVACIRGVLGSDDPERALLGFFGAIERT